MYKFYLILPFLLELKYVLNENTKKVTGLIC